MYKLTRSAMVAQGKGPEAVAFATQVAAHVTEHHTPVQVGVEMAGDQGRIHWFSEYESAAEWEQTGMALVADAEYQNMLVAAGELFIAGMTRDTLVRLFPSD